MREPEQFETVLEEGSVDGIYLDSAHFDAVLWNELANRCHHAGKRCFLVLPHIFREEAFRYFDANKELLANAGFDGAVIRAWEEIGLLKGGGPGNIRS